MRIIFLCSILAALGSPVAAKVKGYYERSESEMSERDLQFFSCNKRGQYCLPVISDCCSGLGCDPLNLKCYPGVRGVGEPCIPNVYPCESGLSCDFPSLNCVEDASKRGQDCGFDLACGGDLYCFNGKCEDRGDIGDECSDTKLCLNNLICGSSDGLCKAKSAENEHCLPGVYPCEKGLTCEADVFICRRPSVLDEPCHLTRPCANGFMCNSSSGLCETAPPVCNLATGVGCGSPTDAPTPSPTPSPTPAPVQAATLVKRKIVPEAKVLEVKMGAKARGGASNGYYRRDRGLKGARE